MSFYVDFSARHLFSSCHRKREKFNLLRSRVRVPSARTRKFFRNCTYSSTSAPRAHNQFFSRSLGSRSNEKFFTVFNSARNLRTFTRIFIDIMVVLWQWCYIYVPKRKSECKKKNETGLKKFNVGAPKLKDHATRIFFREFIIHQGNKT